MNVEHDGFLFDAVVADDEREFKVHSREVMAPGLRAGDLVTMPSGRRRKIVAIGSFEHGEGVLVWVT